jgi:hypothetical protein
MRMAHLCLPCARQQAGSSRAWAVMLDKAPASGKKPTTLKTMAAQRRCTSTIVQVAIVFGVQRRPVVHNREL